MRRRPSPRGCLLMEERARERCVFSPDGGSLAICGVDGEVKVWDSATGGMVLRFSPSGARGQPISSAAWSRPCEQHPHKHKRRKSGSQAHALLALGVGSKVVVWNITKGEQEARLQSVHSEPVTGVAWGPGNGLLYSGSLDKHVAEWSIRTRDSTHKWLADKHGVACICCHDNSDLLLTAGRSIKLWNTSTHSLIKKFAGHATSVAHLAFIGDTLFLSCASNDRVINLWNSGSHDSTAVASLTCECEVASCDVAVDEKDRTLRAAALTEEGLVHLFKYPLTNQITAPITAHSTVQFAMAGAKSDTPSPLPVLAALLSPSGLTVAHSSAVKPTIETLSSSECEGRVCLVRERAVGLLLPGTGKRLASKPQSQSHSVTVLGPGNMTVPTGHTHMSKLSNRITEDSPLSSRLPTEEVAAAGPGPEGESRVATADSLSRLLSQAVQSSDPALLQEVLRVRRESTIRQTVRRLPLPHILPFLHQLIQLLQKSPNRGLELSVWVKCVLTQHSSFLMTQPHLTSVLSSFYQVLEARSSVYSKLCRVHGKLELMMVSNPTERKRGRRRGDRGEEAHGEGAGVPASSPLLSVTVGDELAVAGGSGEESASEESEAVPSDLSESEENDDQLGSDSDVAMDTAEQQELT